MILKQSMVAKYTYILATIFCCESCLKKNTYSNYSRPQDVTLQIEMPQSVTVFEHIEPLFYDALWNHFQRVGFNVTTSPNAFRLVSVIQKFDMGEKFISPDVLPYNFKIHIEVECSLYEPHGEKKASKLFIFDSWASRPLDVRFLSHYNYAEFQRVFDRFVPRIDHYFRKYFTNEF